jgi:hypothetical protein
VLAELRVHRVNRDRSYSQAVFSEGVDRFLVRGSGP